MSLGEPRYHVAGVCAALHFGHSIVVDHNAGKVGRVVTVVGAETVTADHECDSRHERGQMPLLGQAAGAVIPV